MAEVDRDEPKYSLELCRGDERHVVGEFEATVEGRREAMSTKKDIQALPLCEDVEFRLVIPDRRRA